MCSSKKKKKTTLVIIIITWNCCVYVCVSMNCFPVGMFHSVSGEAYRDTLWLHLWGLWTTFESIIIRQKQLLIYITPLRILSCEKPILYIHFMTHLCIGLRLTVHFIVCINIHKMNFRIINIIWKHFPSWIDIVST